MRQNILISSTKFNLLKQMVLFTYKENKVYYDLLFEANKKMTNWENYSDIEEFHPKVTEILKDVPRTFSEYNLFNYHFMFRKVFRVLMVFIEYNNGIDYWQGMNSIIASLCIHVEESIAFWLFVDMLETYNLDDLFRLELNGVHEWINQIKLIVITKYKNVFDHLCILGVGFEMFAVSWIVSMFSSVMPLHLTSIFWNKFFEKGWESFYKLVFLIFKEIENDILEWSDMGEALNVFKILKQNPEVTTISWIDSPTYKNCKITQKWMKILEKL